ncbi:terpenoid synthase [Pholiota conissans]|uniref:Terpenoid synthase n=1 Tax=Pholiota conissans TaxID=109636 RepID=A0A9P6CS82_9AGAR|nr:terpenoid synthase [Pholiota conissans]
MSAATIMPHKISSRCDPNTKGLIRGVIESFLPKIQVPYIVTAYSQDFHNLCCRIALERGYPMSTDRSMPSLFPFIKPGVIMGSVAFKHIEDEARRVYVCFYTAFLLYVDDTYQHTNNERVAVFIERFVRKQKQLDPVLDGLASFLQTTPDYFEPIAANIVLTGALNLINASTLEFQTQGMKASLHAKDYPEFTRQMSGANEAYTMMVFPRSIPIQSYIQCLPDAAIFLGHGNDVLSFYKEELAGETVNYISVLSRCHGISKMAAFEKVANDVANADAQVCKILSEEVDQEAYQTWQTFKVGYVSFHTSFERYHLDELMNRVNRGM